MAENKRSEKGERGGAQRGREQAGMRDPYYDLISVEYHALQGVETTGQYAMDAQEEGHKELAQYFQKTKEQYRQIAEEGKKFLAKEKEFK